MQSKRPVCCTVSLAPGVGSLSPDPGSVFPAPVAQCLALEPRRVRVLVAEGRLPWASVVLPKPPFGSPGSAPQQLLPGWAEAFSFNKQER